jgi:hypothetical protein
MYCLRPDFIIKDHTLSVKLLIRAWLVTHIGGNVQTVANKQNRKINIIISIAIPEVNR